MGKIKKKQKVEIVFDEQKRKEFLSGFRKRKNERRQKAKDEVARLYKEHLKSIKTQQKERMKSMKQSFQPLKELTEEDKTEKFEDDEVEVKIVELSANDFAVKGNMIGANTGGESEEEEKNDQSDAESEIDENTIPGMDLVKKKKRKPNKSTKNVKPTDKESGVKELKSKKDLDRIMKKKTFRALKESKVYKQKKKFEQVANRKKSRKDMNNTIKSLPKHKQKEKKKFNNDVNRKIKKGRGKLKRNK